MNIHEERRHEEPGCSAPPEEDRRGPLVLSCFDRVVITGTLPEIGCTEAWRGTSGLRTFDGVSQLSQDPAR